MRPILVPVLLALAACVGSEPEPAALGDPSDLSGFEGARAGQAELGIQRLGYVPARTEGLVTFWSNPETRACARIETRDGRYVSIRMVAASECGGT